MDINVRGLMLKFNDDDYLMMLYKEIKRSSKYSQLVYYTRTRQEKLCTYYLQNRFDLYISKPKHRMPSGQNPLRILPARQKDSPPHPRISAAASEEEKRPIQTYLLLGGRTTDPTPHDICDSCCFTLWPLVSKYLHHTHIPTYSGNPIALPPTTLNYQHRALFVGST